jgi:hypothetical protein
MVSESKLETNIVSESKPEKKVVFSEIKPKNLSQSNISKMKESNINHFQRLNEVLKKYNFLFQNI